jgi:hypothetical protein
MHYSFFSGDPKNQEEPNPMPPTVVVHEPLHNTNEGSEFLDDAIRMIEQPLEEAGDHHIPPPDSVL